MKPKPSTPRQVETLLLRLGFRCRPGRGSHRFYWHADGRKTVLSFHAGDIPLGTLRRIVRDIGLTVEEFNRSI